MESQERLKVGKSLPATGMLPISYKRTRTGFLAHLLKKGDEVVVKLSHKLGFQTALVDLKMQKGWFQPEFIGTETSFIVL